MMSISDAELRLLGPSSGMRSSCGAGAWLGAFKACGNGEVMEDMGKKKIEKVGKNAGFCNFKPPKMVIQPTGHQK